MNCSLIDRVNVFWVVGDSPVNNVLITDFLTTNQFGGDRLRRVFPLSPFDHSIELSINRTTPERVYSCVIDGTTDVERTIFTYIVRAIGKSIISPENFIFFMKISFQILTQVLIQQKLLLICQKLMTKFIHYVKRKQVCSIHFRECLRSRLRHPFRRRQRR